MAESAGQPRARWSTSLLLLVRSGGLSGRPSSISKGAAQGGGTPRLPGGERLDRALFHRSEIARRGEERPSKSLILALAAAAVLALALYPLAEKAAGLFLVIALGICGWMLWNGGALLGRRGGLMGLISRIFGGFVFFSCVWTLLMAPILLLID